MLHILHRHRAVLPFTAALLCLVFLAGCGAADKEMTDGEGADESGEEIVSVSSGLLAAVTLDDLMYEACLVAEGTIVDVSDAFYIEHAGGGGKLIYTDYTLRVDTVYRGEPYADKVTIRCEGGTVGKETLIAEQSPKLKMDESYLLFLYQPGSGGAYNTQGDYYYVAGQIQGVFSKHGEIYTAQDYESITQEEFEAKLKEMENEPVNESYSRDTFVRNQKSNLDSGFMSQEEYDAAMDSLDQYATIVR